MGHGESRKDRALWALMGVAAAVAVMAGAGALAQVLVEDPSPTLATADEQQGSAPDAESTATDIADTGAAGNEVQLPTTDEGEGAEGSSGSGGESGGETSSTVTEPTVPDVTTTPSDTGNQGQAEPAPESGGAAAPE